MNIGVIGFGRRARSLAVIIKKSFKEMKITAIADINMDYAKGYVDDSGIDKSEIVWYDSGEELIEKAKIDGLIISSNCNSHTHFAKLALKKNIALILEKPASISLEQLRELKKSLSNSTSDGVMSFPLRWTQHAIKVKDIVNSGILGKISQVQAYNNVSYGRVYYKSWYHDDKITGGLFLQKATHDLDCLNFILERKPVSLCAVESKVIFKGDKPAGLMCEDCPEYKTCYESSYMVENVYKAEGSFGSHCSYAVDTGNHDSATVIMQYDDGMHAVYTQNFVVRGSAGKRGARFIGQKGTVEFDFNTNKIILFRHDSFKFETEEIAANLNDGHSGGDYYVIKSFEELMQGKKPEKGCISEGIDSAYICLKAREAAETKSFVNLDFKDLV